MLSLRPYQEEAIKAIRAAWAEGSRRPAAVLPTGAGKTVVFAHLAAQMRPLGVKSLILAHRDELILQAAAKLRSVAPDLRVGIVKASQRETIRRDVIVASVQTLARSKGALEAVARAGVRLVIVDECHHAVADSYMKVLRELGCFAEGGLENGAAALGVTATLGRTDRVALGQVWETVAYQRSILDMIRDGYLVNAKGIRVKVDGLDLRSVARSRGDYRDGALGEAMEAALAPQAVAKAFLEHAPNRRGIVFWPTVSLAHEGAETFSGAGVPSAALDGSMAVSERRRLLAEFAHGSLQTIHNCMILTEGFDAPWCDAVVIARPTSSAPLYIQMAGRALRTHPGKTDALIMDVVGVTGRHRLASVIDLAGADRVEEMPDELAEYDELDLLELMEPDKSVDWRSEPEFVDGPLVAEIVDLFGTRRQSWLRTHRGVWFLSAGDKLIFLTPGEEPGRYSVARCAQHGTGGEWLRENCDLEMAMQWGEQFAAEAGTLVNRSARWRKGEPSDTQLRHARRLGLRFDSNATKGEVSDAISIEYASRRIDAMPCVAGVSQEGYW